MSLVSAQTFQKVTLRSNGYRKIQENISPGQTWDFKPLQSNNDTTQRKYHLQATLIFLGENAQDEDELDKTNNNVPNTLNFVYLRLNRNGQLGYYMLHLQLCKTINSKKAQSAPVTIAIMLKNHVLSILDKMR